jgi:SAM-dependent methyltransferase
VSCPNCGASELEIFHEQDDVPVHSVRLLRTREEAVAFPRGSLRLGFCAECGFITNTAYDPAPQDYGESYEETQGFSPTFSRWADDLARRWVERYDLEGKDVLEIGSGKGEFLISMVEHGAARGVGIDPSFLAERVASPAADKITFIKDYYSERYGHLTGDAVVCRHTLEHIHPTGDFMRLVRRSLNGHGNTVVLFELPDVGRVLREIAFWDIYYEHCSYFTPGSLARLYRLADLDVLDLAIEYDGQYILIEGRPANGRRSRRHPLEEEPGEVGDDVRRFAAGFAATRAAWRDRLAHVRADGRRAVIWGGGSKGVSFLTTLGIADEIDCVVDVNPHKQGMYMAGTGHRVVGPEALRRHRPDLVIVMNPIYMAEIGAELSSLGVKAELVAA